MDWDNEPMAWSESDDRLTLTVDGDTDFWRHTLHDLVADDDHTVASDRRLHHDSEAFTLLRQAYLFEADSLLAGPTVASPEGGGFEAVFEPFSIE